MATDEAAVPDGRCGFTLQPEDIGEEDLYDNIPEWDERNRTVSCWRPVWGSHEATNRCFWHADTDNKSAEDLREHRAKIPERLDGAILRGIEAERPISFSKCGLTGATFENMTITKSDFEGASIRSSQFLNVDLEEANFQNASIWKSNLSNVSLRSSTFQGGFLVRCGFSDADLIDADFSDADLSGAEFSNSILSFAKFLDTDLSQTEFLNTWLGSADVSDSTFRQAKFSDSNISESDFRNVDFSEVEFTQTDLSESNFPDSTLVESEFVDSDLSEAEFLRAELSETDFQESNLEQTMFHDCSFKWARFSNSDLPVARFRDSDLRGTEFHDSYLGWSTFSHSSLPLVNFTECSLYKARLCDSDFQMANFHDVNAGKVDFQHANLQDTIFADTDCRYSTFTNALLHETVFEDTRINSGTTFYDREATFYDSREGTSRLSQILSSVKSTLRFGTSSPSRPVCVYEENSDIAYSDNVPESETLPEGVNRFEAARWVYRRLETLHEENALSEEARAYHISKEEAERKLLKERGDPRRYVKTLMWALSNHGESVKRLLGWWVAVIVTAGVLFPLVGGVKEPDGTTHAIASLGELGTWAGVSDVLLNVYFSVITFSTIGYGDLSPASAWSRVLVAGESLVGAILVALLVFVLGRRVAR